MNVREVAEVVGCAAFVGVAARELGRRSDRPPLSFDDWFPPRGWLGICTLIAVGLIYAGCWVTFGAHQTFRLGGIIAPVGGLALSALLIRYFRLPSRPTRAVDKTPSSSDQAD